MQQIRRWHVYPRISALTQDVVRKLARLANDSIEKRSAFHITLAGGATPQVVYRGLRHIDTDWSAWHLYFGDERCLPRGHPERNDTMARESWYKHVAIPAEQIYSIPAELGNKPGSRAYARILRDVDEFDLVLLGLGEDGHTASLFPGRELGEKADASDVLAINSAPKAPAARVTLSANRLSRSLNLWFLVTGEGKRNALKEWRRDGDIPALSIRPIRGVDIYTDIPIRNN